MDEQQFDSLTRRLAGWRSRRSVLKGLAGAAALGTLAVTGTAETDARQCRVLGRNCRSNADCCTDYCDNDNNAYKCTCPPGLGDCDGDGHTCETDLTTVSNCGACGNDCAAQAPPHTVASCAGGQCAFACAAGFGDCNDDLSDGCETALFSNTNCQACGNDCTARGGWCTSSGCQCAFQNCYSCGGVFDPETCCYTDYRPC